MQFTTPFAVIALISTISAAPTSENIGRAPVIAFNQNGSIYRYGSHVECRQIFRANGACGISTYFNDVDPDMPLVAMPADVFDRYGQAQNNKLCGKVITMTHDGVTRKAIVADRNLSNDDSIDMCLEMWEAFGGHDNDGTLIGGFGWTIDIQENTHTNNKV